MWIERFATTYEHTVRLLGVVATFSAVGVSLWLAARAARTRLKATASLQRFLGPEIDPQNAPTFLVLKVTNTGSVTVRLPIELLKWKAPLKFGAMVQPPLEVGNNPYFLIEQPPRGSKVSYIFPSEAIRKVMLVQKQRSYPLEIAPRASEVFFICDKAGFQSGAKDFLRANNSFLDRLRFRFIRAWVQTDDGKKFRVKLSKEVRDIWRSARE